MGGDHTLPQKAPTWVTIQSAATHPAVASRKLPRRDPGAGVARCVQQVAVHSTLKSAALITGVHRAVSARMIAASASGVVPVGSTPS